MFVRVITRVKSTPDPDDFEKYCDTPPVSNAMLSQRHEILLAESRIYTTNLYHDAASIWYRDTFAEVLGSGVVFEYSQCGLLWWYGSLAGS